MFHFRSKLLIKDFSVTGLSSLKLDAMDYNPDSKQFKISFTPPQLHIKGNYSLDTEIDFNGKMKVSHKDEGCIDVDFKLPGKEVGFSFEFSNDEATGNLTTQNWKIYHEEINWDEKLKHLERNEFFPVLKKIKQDLYENRLQHTQEVFNEIVGEYKDVQQLTEFFNKESSKLCALEP